ncbi:MAG: type IV pilus assembly protein PilM [Candidatus Aminicenantes bacterium]|nr:MAG: type IV pilus assembly protein PilM [Candidatus Aminicenantes bacterium]
MISLKREKGIVGLDIGSYAIKAVELTAKKKNEFEVESIGYELLPRDAIVEGTIMDSEAVAGTIKMIFDENKISNKSVSISISGTSVIIKKISLPAMESEELAESIIWEAKHNIPYPYEETNVDYTIMKPPADSAEKNLDILLVAAKKDKIANYSSVVDQARKSLRAIEVDVFALQNAMEVNYPEIAQEKTAAIVNLGANITNLIIIEKGTPQLFRDLSLGGFLFIENMRKELGISFDDAEKTLKGLPAQDTAPEQIQAVLTTSVENLLSEIEKTFSFFRAGEQKESKIDQIFLSGGLSSLKDLPLFFEQRFKIKTELFNPFNSISFNEKKLDSIYFQEMASSFGVATGLATRKAEK